MIDALLNICKKIWRMAHYLGSVTGNYSSKEKQPATVSELSHD